MFLLFSSNAERLFQRGILEVLALPEGHPVVFRYQSKYVAESITEHLRRHASRELLRDKGNRALIIYAEKPTENCDSYQYCPIRFAQIRSLRLLGDIVFVAMTLRECANLQGWEDTSDKRVAFLRAIRGRAGALVGETGQGCFFDFTNDCDWDLWSDEQNEGQIWQTVVDKLAAMPSMEKCLFYRVRGFFDKSGRTIAPRTALDSAVYPIPMSKVVDLKLLFYRPSSAVPRTISASFEIEADKTGFSEIPDKRIILESRYDEISVQLASQRVFDNILAPVSIRLKESTPNDVLASEPLLLCNVRVPPVYLLLLVAAFFFAPILLALEAEDVSWLLTQVPHVKQGLGIVDPTAASARIAAYAKLFGGLIAAWAGFIIFRRLPVSK